MNVVHMLNVERITKSLCLRYWHESQMTNWAGLIWGQILHCTVQNSSQMLRGGGGEMGSFGIDQYISWTHFFASG